MNVATRVVSALLEDDDIDRLTSGIDPDELGSDVEISIEVSGCIDDGQDTRVADEGEVPQFWTVYKRLHTFDEQGAEQEALAQAHGDYPTEAEAQAEAQRLTSFYERTGKLYVYPRDQQEG